MSGRQANAFANIPTPRYCIEVSKDQAGGNETNRLLQKCILFAACLKLFVYGSIA
jgi:hypothetical protein